MQTLNRDTVLKLYKRLVALVEKLPGRLQRPIMQELVPIQEFFLEQRPPKIVILGGAKSMTAPAILHYLCGSLVETGDAQNGWRTYRVGGRGSVEILDARAETPAEIFETAIATEAADAVLFVRGDSDAAGEFEREFTLATERLVLCDHKIRPGMVALAFGGAGARTRLDALLHSHREFVQRPLQVFEASPEQAGAAAEALCGMLPNGAKLEFARMAMARGAQVEISKSLLKSFTAVCGVIGMQPIPLADLPILTTLQSLLVGLVVYVSGRRASPRLMAEFAGALGINIGAGFAFREGARALLKVFPFWGNAVSGLVAGAGTYAIGRAAIACFIEDLPMQETRKLFKRLQPGLQSFKARAIPSAKDDAS